MQGHKFNKKPGTEDTQWREMVLWAILAQAIWEGLYFGGAAVGVSGSTSFTPGSTRLPVVNFL